MTADDPTTRDATTRRAVLRSGVAGLLALAGCSGGGDGGDGSGSPGNSSGTDGSGTDGSGTDAFTFETPAFEDGGTIPQKYTCAGEDVSPPLSLSGVPSEAGSVALVVDDPDAPVEGAFTHWLVWNLPTDVGSIPEGVARSETLSDLGGARQGTNDFDEVGYRGPCPPKSDGAHTYRFRAYAVSGTLSVSAGAGTATLTDALDPETVGTASFTGEFDRN